MTEVIKKTGINFGIITGVVMIIITTVMYIIDISLFVNIWLGISLFLINLVIGIIAVAKAKKGLGGFITFKEAFTVFFIVMAIGSLFNVVFMYVLFNIIDPGAQDTIKEQLITKSVTWMRSMGLKTEDIRKSVDEMKATESFSLVSLIKSYFSGLLMYAIIGLIVAIALRNKTKAE